MDKRLSDEIEPAAKETVENLCNALTEFAKSCAIASKALEYYYIILLKRSASLAYEQYLYAKATTKILCERYMTQNCTISGITKESILRRLKQNANYANYITLIKPL